MKTHINPPTVFYDQKGLSVPKTPEGQAMKQLYEISGRMVLPKERTRSWRYFGQVGAFMVSCVNAFATSGDAYYAALGLGHSPVFFMLGSIMAMGTWFGFFCLYQPNIFRLIKGQYAKNTWVYHVFDSLHKALDALDHMGLPYDQRMDCLLDTWQCALRDQAAREDIRNFLKQDMHARGSLQDFMNQKGQARNHSLQQAVRLAPPEAKGVLDQLVSVLCVENISAGFSETSVAEKECQLILLLQGRGLTGAQINTTFHVMSRAMGSIRDQVRRRPDTIGVRTKKIQNKLKHRLYYLDESVMTDVLGLLDGVVNQEKVWVASNAQNAHKYSAYAEKACIERIKSRFSQGVDDRIHSEQRYRESACAADQMAHETHRRTQDDQFNRGLFEKGLKALGDFIGTVGAFSNGSLGFLGLCTLTGLTCHMGMVSSPALLVLAIVGALCMAFASYSMTRVKLMDRLSALGRWMDRGGCIQDVDHKIGLFFSMVLCITAGGGVAGLAFVAGKGLVFFMFSALGVAPISWVMTSIAFACLVSTFCGVSMLLLSKVRLLVQRSVAVLRTTQRCSANAPFAKTRDLFLNLLGLNDRWHVLTAYGRLGVLCSRLVSLTLVVGCAVAQSVMSVTGWTEHFGLFLVGAVLSVFVGITFAWVVASDIMKVVHQALLSVYCLCQKCCNMGPQASLALDAQQDPSCLQPVPRSNSVWVCTSSCDQDEAHHFDKGSGSCYNIGK